MTSKLFAASALAAAVVGVTIPATASATQAVTIIDPTANLTVTNRPAASVGWRFAPTTNLLVTQLGLFDWNGDGFSGSHRVGIFDSSSARIASTNFTAGTSDPLVNGFRFRLIEPLLLAAGRTYYIGAYDDGTDPLSVFQPGFTIDSRIGYDIATIVSSADLDAPLFEIGAGRQIIGANFVFSGGVPEPMTWALMILGFGVVGGALRRAGRRRSAVTMARVADA